MGLAVHPLCCTLMTLKPCRHEDFEKSAHERLEHLLITSSPSIITTVDSKLRSKNKFLLDDLFLISRVSVNNGTWW